MRQIVFDTETTGLDPENGDKIVEIGLIEILDNKVTNKELHFFINPQKTISADSTRIHGITNEMVKDSPVFNDIADELLDFIGDANLIAHNAVFDMKFLNAELINCGRSIINKDKFIDTLKIAQNKFPGQRNTLDALCDKFNIDKTSRSDRHGALIDSYLLAEVYFNIIRKNFMELMNNKGNNNNPDSLLNPDKQHISSKFTNRKYQVSLKELEKHKEFIENKIKNSLWVN